MIIRTANINDAPRLADLTAQLGYALSLEQTQHKIMAFNQREQHAIFVAEKQSVVCGFISLICYELFNTPENCLHIDCLVVDANRQKINDRC